MVIVKLQGGLGNQMFQYAAARRLAGNEVIYIDDDFFASFNKSTDDFTARAFELHVFENIRLKMISSFIRRTLTGQNNINKFLKKILFPKASYIHQTEKNEFINLEQTKGTPIYLDGYFQNEDYFKTIRKQLLLDFKFPAVRYENKEIANQINSDPHAVSIHVRRGDYLKLKTGAFHGLLPFSYYQLAQQKIEEEIPAPHYYVFSDDPEWCCSAFSSSAKAVTIVSNRANKSWEDMYLMSICKHHIIANSSYSWWAAWLNNYPQKMVIAPDKWFATASADIVPPQWIRI